MSETDETEFPTSTETDDETCSEINVDDTSETDATTDDADAPLTSADGTETGDATETDITSDVAETIAELTSEATSIAESQEDKSNTVLHLFPRDILNLDGRHIRAEDFEWATPPIPPLSEIVIEKTADKIKGSELETFLKFSSVEQRGKILAQLPLDLPLSITVPIIEDGTYWQRMCLNSWPAWDLWRFSVSWKSMFLHRTAQELIENFIPGSSDIRNLVQSLKDLSTDVKSFKIHKLMKSEIKIVSVDLSSENFDEILDDVIQAPVSSVYANFETIFESVPQLQDLEILLYPRHIDHEILHFNVVDFNNLFRGLSKLKRLKSFRVSNGSLANEQLTMVIKLFLTHKCLTQVNFSFNFIDDATCDYLGKLLISECPLESLILKYNRITDSGVKSIAAALFQNNKLKILDLSLNMIGDDGGCFLAKVLESNTTLKDLDVSKNKLKAESGIQFAELVKSSLSLRSLKIQENRLGEVVGKLLSRYIPENNSLLELDVHFCGFRFEDEGSIHQSILRNRLKFPYTEYVKKGKTASEFLF